MTEDGVGYKYIEFKSQDGGDITVKPTMAEGRMYITNSRVMFLTAEQLKGIKSTKVHFKIFKDVLHS